MRSKTRLQIIYIMHFMSNKIWVEERPLKRVARFSEILLGFRLLIKLFVEHFLSIEEQINWEKRDKPFMSASQSAAR